MSGPARSPTSGWGVPSDVPHAILVEVSQRTPGFIGWQQEHWLYHCADAAAFLGRVGWDDVAGQPDAVASLRADLTGRSLGAFPPDAQPYYERLVRIARLTLAV